MFVLVFSALVGVAFMLHESPTLTLLVAIPLPGIFLTGLGGESAASLNRYLFEELGFRGNRDDYYDPRNSYLNQVLERRVGIPITLSVLYLEIATRIGLDLKGVSFPGHFMVKLNGERNFKIFLSDAQRYGTARALQRQYGIASVQALEAAWKRASVGQ